MGKRDIILIGGGGHCRSCIDVIDSGQEFKVVGIVEQSGSNKAKSILGYPVLGYDNDLEALKNIYDCALITVGQMGSSRTRQEIFNLVKKLGFVLPVIVSSLAHVSQHASIGEGSIVMHRAIVNAGARIGHNCILNTQCLVEHDVTIGDHTHVSTAAVVNGGAVIGSGSFVGSNTTIVQGIRLPDNHFYKAGSLICSEKDGRLVKETLN
ncbi:MAG: NeuD/PglB/VioB family sugar acetyltransferase [Proteobacteria bacterium]|nr:NeuD/PglB/VioB family sugar acetyltransferase [Pseudomonadota bacterium]